MEEIGACGVPVQLSYRVVPEIQIPDIEGRISKVCRRDNQIALRVEISRNIGAERGGRSRARRGKHTAKELNFGSGRHTEGQDGDKGFQELSGAEAQAVLGQSFLEPRVLYKHSRSGREQDKALRKISGRE